MKRKGKERKKAKRSEESTRLSFSYNNNKKYAKRSKGKRGKEERKEKKRRGREEERIDV